MPSLKALLSGLINPCKSSKEENSKRPPTPALPASPTRTQRRRAKVSRPPRAPSPFPTLNTAFRDPLSEPAKTHTSPSSTWSSYKKAQEVAMRDEEERSERETMEQEKQITENDGSEKGSALSMEFRMWLKNTVDFGNFTASALH